MPLDPNVMVPGVREREITFYGARMLVLLGEEESEFSDLSSELT